MKIKSIQKTNTTIIWKSATVALLLIVSNVFMVLADDPGEPCDLADPIGDCPIDNWTIFLAIIAVAFAVFQLVKKNNAHRDTSL